MNALMVHRQPVPVAYNKIMILYSASGALSHKLNNKYNSDSISMSVTLRQ